MVLTGVDDGDESFLQMSSMHQALPQNTQTDNNMVVRFNANSQNRNTGGNSTGFRPVYD